MMMTTTTTEEVNVDEVLHKYETYDAEVMDALLTRTDSFSKRDLGNLGRYKRGRRNGNEVEVIYEYGRGCEKNRLGRLYARGGQGLQSFPFDIRNPLLAKHYWDIDMENCHYNILSKLADGWGLKTDSIRQYISNRDAELTKVSANRGIAKTAFLKVAYGGNVKLHGEFYNDDGIGPEGDISLIRKIEVEMKCIVDLCWSKFPEHHSKVSKKSNPRFSLFALILQTEERKCLLAMDSYFKSQKRSMDIFIHDGGEVRKLKGEESFPEELLRGCEKAITEKTGYSMHVVNKPLKHHFEFKEDDGLLSSEIMVDDAYAAEVFVKLMGDHIVMDSGQVWVFDDSTGIWSNEEAHLERVITNCKAKLVFKQMGPTGIVKYNYSGSVKNTKNLITKLPSVLPKSDGYMFSKMSSDYGKLLFRDGIYDFTTGSFTKGFDSAVVFKKAMPRNFPTVKDEKVMEDIMKHSFSGSFVSETEWKLLLHNFMRAAIGDFKRKKMVGAIGPTNSGKGMITKLCSSAFGSYCGYFNGNSMLTRTEGGESSREMGWLYDVVDCRFAFSSEIRMPTDEKSKVHIEGNMLKTIVSGGDPIKIRKLYSNEVQVVNKATLFMLCNDMPKINPIDEAVRQRIQSVTWSYQFVDGCPALGTMQRKADMTLSSKYESAEYGDAFFWMMVDEFNRWARNGYAEPEIPENMLLARDDLLQLNGSLEEVLSEEYEITRNPEHWVPVSDLQDFFKGKERGSATKIGLELNVLGCPVLAKKVAGKVVRGRTGLRKKV